MHLQLVWGCESVQGKGKGERGDTGGERGEKGGREEGGVKEEKRRREKKNGEIIHEVFTSIPSVTIAPSSLIF